MEEIRDCAPLGATECYGFPVGGSFHWHLSDEERAEQERAQRTDKPNKRYYLEKYAQIFLIFWKAAEEGIYHCSNQEWDYLWNRYEYYRERSEDYADQKDYEPSKQRQDTKVMWEKLYELKRENSFKSKH